ncbi:MAG: AgmX/PglI C-terminal domain-containing protein [Myxococcaceae bacterium]|nr:AgmX/PglI C-terminal domain-containing protein [Myxococcaceae bacterium]
MFLPRALAMVLGASWADGGLSLEEFDDVLALHAAELAPCRAKSAKGAAIVQLGVSDEGLFEWNSVLADSRPESAVCLVKQLRAWRFPSREVATRVQYEWRGSPRPLTLEAGLQEWPRDIGQESLANCYVWKRPARDTVGVIRARLVVGPSGAVLESRLLDISPSLKELEPCVLDATRSWRLPPRPRGASMEATWSFLEAPPGADAGGRIVITPASATESYRTSVETGRGVREQSGTLDACANSGDRESRSSALLEFTILEDGGVVDVRENEISPVMTCVVQQVKQWSFPSVRPSEPLISLWRVSAHDGGIDFQGADDEGGLDRSVIKGTVDRHSWQIRRCYNERLRVEPGLCGQVRLQWLISKTGLPVDVEAEVNSTGDRELERCMVERVQSWVFARPFGGGRVAVTYPYLFRVDEADAGCCATDAGFRMCR